MEGPVWSDEDGARRIHRQGRNPRSQTIDMTGAQQMSRTKSFALRLAGLAAFALVLAAPFRWY